MGTHHQEQMPRRKSTATRDSYSMLRQRPASSSSPPPPPPRQQEDEDVDAVVGVALNTRNYMALLQGASPPAPIADTTRDNDDAAVVGVALNTRNYQALLARNNVPAVQPQNNSDDTVVGLPVATRNYMALLNESNQQELPLAPTTRASEPGPRRGPKAEATSYKHVDDDNQANEESDAVLGLPISTGNYNAMYREDAKQKIRQRGYSELSGGAARRGGGHTRYSITQDSSGTAPDRHHARRDSCFDRRSLTGAVIPQKGWMFIKSPTMKTWKRYYAVLSGLDFRYSVEPGRASKGFGTVQSARRWTEKPFGLMMVYTSGKEVPMYCEDEATREVWLESVSRALEKRYTATGHSKTSYTLPAGEQHEGVLVKQDPRTKSWREQYFVLRGDGYLVCKDSEHGHEDPRSSGYVKAVSFADVHANGLVFEVEGGIALFVYSETYDERMLWYAAVSAAASASDKVSLPTTAVRSSYVQTARPNHGGWLYKQMGLFKSWKRVYVSLHGVEIGYARDANSPLEECEKIHSIEEWDGRPHGLEIRLKSGQLWRVHAESYETAKQWRNVIGEVCRHAEHVNIKRYLASRARKNQPPVFGGWLTTNRHGGRFRQFYVMDGNMFGVADEVDNLLQPIGRVVDVGATRDVANGMLLSFADGSRLKVAGDSVDAAKAWYDCLSVAL